MSEIFPAVEFENSITFVIILYLFYGFILSKFVDTNTNAVVIKRTSKVIPEEFKISDVVVLINKKNNACFEIRFRYTNVNCLRLDVSESSATVLNI